MTPITRVAVLPVASVRRQVSAACAAAFVAGFVAASALPNAMMAEADVTLPQPVSRMVRQIGDYLCDGWGGMTEAYLVAPHTFSYVCRHHAIIRGVRIVTKP